MLSKFLQNQEQMRLNNEYQQKIKNSQSQLKIYRF